MNRITFPLKPQMKGPEVGDLQRALQLFLERGFILHDDEGARRTRSAALQRELARNTYGAATRQLVGIFQKSRRLPSGGAVDKPTADAINDVLREWGLLEQPEARAAFVVSGQVRRDDDVPFKNGLVRAFHETERGAIRLGEDTADAEGRYTIRYELLPETLSINLRVSVTDEDGRLAQSSDIIQGAAAVEVVNLTVPISRRPVLQRRLEGRLVLEHGLPAGKVTLRLYRRDFGGAETRLAEVTTREDGLFALSYDAGGKPVSLEVRAVDPAGKEIPVSRILHDVGEEEGAAVDLVAPASLQPLAAEYQRLAADLLPHVGGMKELARARENPERQDITVLNRATGWDARVIALAAKAADLAADETVGLSQEVLYGLSRVGLPSDKVQLAHVSVEALEHALAKATQAGIIELSATQMADAKAKFETFAIETRLSVPAPGSRATYRDLLKSSGLSEVAQTEFARIYLRHRRDASQLWEEARKARLDVGRLQLHGKLAFLTGNSQGMTARLMQKPISDPVQLVQQDFHRADSWSKEVLDQAGVPWSRRNRLTESDKKKLDAEVPPAYAGEKIEDRLAAYAEDMARKVRLSYPTQVVARMVEQDARDDFKLGPARAKTATLLKNAAAKGFRLGQTPVATFLRSHKEILDDLDPPDRETVKESVKTLQRVYQITPSDEAMVVLMKQGLTSAYAVVEMSRDVFVDRYGPEFSSQEEAELVYRKAQQVSSVTYNLFTMARKLDSEPPVYGMSAPVGAREIAKNGLMQQFPTMESLFGSMDFCECEHCRSVLSPAAYLVDLLQFVDAEPQAWANFLTDWKQKHNGEDYSVTYKKPYDELIARRPDIPHISLTCENTHTALPYIDVVNEILEYYVAHDRLEDRAARDTVDATTAELLAEPRNVIAEAYDTLKHARYPLTLPFDLWLETVRQFCNHFETPLWRVLESLRSGDELFVPTQSYDRAAVFMESLGLSPSETAIFTNPDPLTNWYELYGYATGAEATTEDTDATSGQRIDLNSAKTLSRRLGVTYKELVEIIQTGFVNPKLTDLVILYKLGVTIQDVLFYRDHKALLFQDPDTLTLDDQKRREEVQGFEQRIETNQYSATGFDAGAWLNTALQDRAFDDILVLVDPDAGCDFDRTTLRYAFRQVEGEQRADAIAFLKINLFVRLWRTLGWTIEETDRALQTLVPKNTPFDAAHLFRSPLQTALIYMAHLKALKQQLPVGEQSLLKLLTLWSDLPTTGRRPLYAQLFLTRSVLKSDDVFDDALGRYLSPLGVASMAALRMHRVQLENVGPADKIDPAAFAGKPLELSYDELSEVQHLSYKGVINDVDKAALGTLSASHALMPLLDAVEAKAQEFTLVKGHLPALQGALGLTADEIDGILKDTGRDPAAAELSLDTVSRLYRYRLMAKGLKLSVAELIAIKQLSGLDPFKTLRDDPVTTLAEDHPFVHTLRFVEVVEHVKDSGLTIEDLEYLLRHRFDQTGKYRPNSSAARALTNTLGEGIRAIRAIFSPPLQEPQIRQFIVETMTAQLDADSRVIEALLSDTRLLADPKPLLDAFANLTLNSETTIERAERAQLLLRKVLQLIQGLNLTDREVRHLLTHGADIDALDLIKLPTRAGDDTPAALAKAQALFRQFLRLAGYARLKRDLAGGTDDLVAIFEAESFEQESALIAKLARREEDTVKATARALLTSPRFTDERAVQRLWDALQVVERFGVSVPSIFGWTAIVGAALPEQRFEIARDLKAAIKARFEPEAWQRVAQPMFDTLRRRQRDALTAYVMHKRRLARVEQLYEYFLIDPGMEPVVQTSRIRLALGSVQLFIQRCLLNLENEVHPSAINAKQWEWMKRYRVWEANRKIFLFPENWLEPEFRDDKTHLFRELEGTLLQGDVSSDLAEDAFLGYLKKLEELARLDIVGMHFED
jgi:hypothetical protein